jgi:hypothetical protein
MGHSRGLADARDTSVVAPIADIGAAIDFRREVPQADIRQWPDLLETLPDEAVNFNRAHDCDGRRL